jgi:lipase ATG15
MPFEISLITLILVSVGFTRLLLGQLEPQLSPAHFNSADDYLTVHLRKDYSTQVEGSTIHLHTHDSDNFPAFVNGNARLRTKPMTVYKPRSIETFMDSRFGVDDEPVEWVEYLIQGPDVEDRHTLQQLAFMSGNAYAIPGQKNWYDLDETWNQVSAR